MRSVVCMIQQPIDRPRNPYPISMVNVKSASLHNIDYQCWLEQTVA